MVFFDAIGLLQLLHHILIGVNDWFRRNSCIINDWDRLNRVLGCLLTGVLLLHAVSCVFRVFSLVHHLRLVAFRRSCSWRAKFSILLPLSSFGGVPSLLLLLLFGITVIFALILGLREGS